jgi:hypothetical protein
MGYREPGAIEDRAGFVLPAHRKSLRLAGLHRLVGSNGTLQREDKGGPRATIGRCPGRVGMPIND